MIALWNYTNGKGVSRVAHSHTGLKNIFSASNKSRAYLLSKLVAFKYIFCAATKWEINKGTAVSHISSTNYISRGNILQNNEACWKKETLRCKCDSSSSKVTSPHPVTCHTKLEIISEMATSFFDMLPLMHLPCPQCSYHRFSIWLQYWFFSPCHSKP